jgi:hypothetical protein
VPAARLELARLAAADFESDSEMSVGADTMTSLVITSWERRFREWLEWRHGHFLESRERAVRAVEETARRERERREAEARALQSRRRRLLHRAVDRARRAQEIRALVADLQSSPAAQGVDQEGFARWQAWALAQADHMDLRVQSPSVLAEWVCGFEL